MIIRWEKNPAHSPQIVSNTHIASMLSLFLMALLLKLRLDKAAITYLLASKQPGCDLEEYLLRLDPVIFPANRKPHRKEKDVSLAGSGWDDSEINRGRRTKR